MAKWKPEEFPEEYYCEWNAAKADPLKTECCGKPATWRLGRAKAWSCDRHLVKMMRKSFEVKP